jgi:Uma2 family endonuclease
LAIEVVSEGEENRRRDLEVKRQEYARARIPEYWIVDAEQNRIIVLALDGDAYREHGMFGADDLATSTVLDGFAVAVKDVLAAANE